MIRRNITFGSAPDRKEMLLDSVLLDSLRPLFLGTSVIMPLAAIYLATTEPLGTGLLYMLLGLALGSAFFKAHRLLLANRIPTRFAHPLAAMMSTVGFMILLYDLVSGDNTSSNARFVGIALMVVMAGALFLTVRWLLSMMTFYFVTWVAVSLAVGFEIVLNETLILFGFISFTTLINYAGRKWAISRMIDAQLENDRQNEQLAAALERAHLSEAQLRAERDLADQIVDSMGQGLVLIDGRGVIEYVNPAAGRILNQPADLLVGRDAGEIFHDADARSLLVERDGKKGQPFEILVERGDGASTHVQVSVALRESGGRILNLTDLTLRKRFEARLERLAHYDALTGLANRSLFLDRVQQELVRLQRRPSRMAVLFLDLDRFKPINDSAGHAVGDQVLIGTANRIQACIREQDTAARIGGDEFVVLLVDIDDTDMTLEIADRIVRRVEEPFVVEGQAHTVSISIGIVTNQSPAAEPEDLLRAADTAMYEAKRRPDVSRILYTPDLKTHAQQQLSSRPAT